MVFAAVAEAAASGKILADNSTINSVRSRSRDRDLKRFPKSGAFSNSGIPVLPLAFRHGHLRVFGYRIGGLAYVTDVKSIPDAERSRLQGLDVLVLNALWWRAHPTHLSIGEAIETAQALGARRTYLTHLTHETGHAELAGQLPEGIFPAYDGLTVEVA